ncbi:MAG TPA: NADP-dependent oxidoreductase [Actinomycetes bacterium]
MKALAIAGRDAAPAVAEIPTPEPATGEVRLRLEAASVNGFDLAVAAGYVWDVMPHEFPVVLGRDFVGTVDAVGADVTQVKVGDRVAGLIAGGLGAGGIGQSVVAAADSLVVVPAGLSSVDAAAVGLAGIAALDAVDAAGVTADDTVLVSGAAGGVGSLAVQLASARGAAVIATARPGEQADFVSSLGAKHVVDYAGDVAAAVREIEPDGVDKVVHAAGDPAALATTLRAGGVLSSLVGAAAEQLGRADVTVTAVMAHATPEKLADLLAQVADGRLQVHVGATVPIERAGDALSAFSGTLGKVIVTG